MTDRKRRILGAGSQRGHPRAVFKSNCLELSWGKYVVETELAPLGEGKRSPGFPGDGWLLSAERVAVTGCRVGIANRACLPPVRMLHWRAEGFKL